MTGGPHSIQSVLTGDLDVGGSFNGAIVKLVASGAPLTSIMALYGTDELIFQGFYALETSPIRGPRDFIGRKVAINSWVRTRSSPCAITSRAGGSPRRRCARSP